MHIKRVELSHFKSFGGTTAVPLLPGFTVISGPNGSGKSNILDALLFALGLASSRGMRADRLPDLVNQSHMGRRSTAEATVTVTFDISDVSPDLIIDRNQSEDENANTVDVEATHADGADSAPRQDGPTKAADGSAGEAAATAGKVVPLPTPPREWTVTRRLRVTNQGTYTSNYYINSEPCTLTELHEQLQRFHVYPEGYNVVLQGDVTSIISMNSRERREIIDELAGVASFDRKINQALEKLEVVREREERFRVVERELIGQRDRLAQDRIKAEKYQRLKAELHTRNEWEAVLTWRQQQQQVETLRQLIQQDAEAIQQLGGQVRQLDETLQTTAQELDTLNTRVKALGEDEHLALQSQLATQEAEFRQQQRQQQGLTTDSQTTAAHLRQSQIQLQEHQQTLARLTEEIHILQQGELVTLTRSQAESQAALAAKREATSAIASASQAWVEEQTQRRRQIEDLLRTLEPQRSEQVRLQERVSQLTQQIEELSATVQELAQQIEAQHPPAQGGDSADHSAADIQRLAQTLADAERELKVQQETQQRLLQEQRQKQRELDKLEAQTQAMQESQGTQATQILIDSGLPGICGLVAQLGRVDPRFQLALEIAAGGRLGYLVVETDQVASQGISLLKQRRAGRATFLPLNAIRVPKISRIPDWKRPDGLVNYAVDLIDCDDRYRKVFEFVFGSTAVFETLQAARAHLGQQRMVTLEGELLETSGAMTGGSLSKQRGRLHFGTVEPGESEEAIALRDRLAEIDQILSRCDQQVGAASVAVKAAADALLEARQQHREQELQTVQVQKTTAPTSAATRPGRNSPGPVSGRADHGPKSSGGLGQPTAGPGSGTASSARCPRRPRTIPNPQRVAAGPVCSTGSGTAVERSPGHAPGGGTSPAGFSGATRAYSAGPATTANPNCRLSATANPAGSATPCPRSPASRTPYRHAADPAATECVGCETGRGEGESRSRRSSISRSANPKATARMAAGKAPRNPPRTAAAASCFGN